MSFFDGFKHAVHVSRIHSLVLNSPRLPCSVLPGQEGNRADHVDLVRRSQPLPAHRVPGERRSDLHRGHRSDGGVHQGGPRRQEHGGVIEQIEDHIEEYDYGKLT